MRTSHGIARVPQLHGEDNFGGPRLTVSTRVYSAGGGAVSGYERTLPGAQAGGLWTARPVLAPAMRLLDVSKYKPL